MRIFGCETSGVHGQIAEVCRQLLEDAASDANDRSFAWNLIHDHRVGKEWAAEWFQRYGQPRSRQDLHNALVAYHSDLRERSFETYAGIDGIARNFISRAEPGSPEGGSLLVHVLDLWSPPARTIWNHGVISGAGVLARVGPFNKVSPRIPPGIAAILESRSTDGQLPLMDAFFAVQRDYLELVDRSRRRGYAMAILPPVWVGRWEAWRRRVGASAEDWCAAVGLSKDPGRTPAWIAVLQYPASHARRLIRPTQLEAGWYGRHFPTPPDCGRELGGRAVEGRDAIASASGFASLPEFLHAPVPWAVEHWLAAGFPALPTAHPVGDPAFLPRDRATHWRCLQQEFAGTEGWMSRPDE